MVWCGVTRVHKVAALSKARIEGLVRVLKLGLWLGIVVRE